MRDIREEKNLPFGRFPLGFCSLGDHLGGDAAVRRGCLALLLPGADQSEHVTRASEGKIWKCLHLPEPTFCGFCILSLPKALFWPDLFVWR